MLRGIHLPPKYCHASHTRITITGTDHGISGLVAKLTPINVDQTPWRNKAIKNATNPDFATKIIRRERECSRVLMSHPYSDHRADHPKRRSALVSNDSILLKVDDGFETGRGWAERIRCRFLSLGKEARPLVAAIHGRRWLSWSSASIYQLAKQFPHLALSASQRNPA